MSPQKRNWFAALVMVVALPGIGFAQGLTYDARIMAMGGGGGNTPNIARRMVPAKARAEMVIPIPVGLIQVFKGGFDKFKPSSDNFDPLLAAETTGSLFYYRFGADTGSTRTDLITDLVNGTVNPDLTTYQGFHVQEQYESEGLFAPQVGMTLKFAKSGSRFQGLYIGVGPYVSYRTSADVDERLTDLFGEGTRYPNVSMSIVDASAAQIAGALTVGYRGHFPMAWGTEDRDGVYLAYNFHFLKGFNYYQPDFALRFDTNAAGDLAAAATPLSILSVEGDNGTGRASDIGIQIVRGNVQGGVGVNGIGNRINWKDFTQTSITLPSLTAGSDFIKTPGAPPFQELQVKLPVVKTANLSFEGGGWGATATIVDGYNGTTVSGGLERQLGPLWLRGGGRHSRDHWDPTVGFGIGTKTALDVVAFSTHANFQDERQWAIGASLRFGR
jgi:hypothetical protein